MVRKTSPSPRQRASGRRQASRSRSRGRSVDRASAITAMTTRSRSRSRSRGPSRDAQLVVQLEDSASLVRRRVRTPAARVRTSTRKAAEDTEKSVKVEGPEKETASADASLLLETKSPIVALGTEDEATLPSAAVDAVDSISPCLPEPALASCAVAQEPVAPHREFCGPCGTAFMTLALPLIVAYATECATSHQWNLFLPDAAWFQALCARMNAVKCSDLTLPFASVLGWYAFQAVLYMLPIGSVADGAVLKDGSRLRYRCNGFFALVLTFVIFFLDLAYNGSSQIAPIITENVAALGLASFVYSIIIAVLVYIKARAAPASQLAISATGNVAYDFFMGRELNPRLCSFDLKFFFEMRPGLIGWALINLCFAWSSVSTLARLVAAFQIFYVADALWNESAILTTFDILHEGFGFMLVFGDVVWVPFLYTLQTRYLAHYLAGDSTGVQDYWIAVAAFVINAFGYMIFRLSNNEKNEFRKDPFSLKVTGLESMPTPSGKRLLVSGWWGVCRRPNYLGDLLMALAWALPCGCGSAVPYLHLVSFVALLVHRLARDEAQCRQRYGASTWDSYCERVPYKIIPYVY